MAPPRAFDATAPRTLACETPEVVSDWKTLRAPYAFGALYPVFGTSCGTAVISPPRRSRRWTLPNLCRVQSESVNRVVASHEWMDVIPYQQFGGFTADKRTPTDGTSTVSSFPPTPSPIRAHSNHTRESRGVKLARALNLVFRGQVVLHEE